MEIAKQLQNPNFRFVLIKHKSKVPYEVEWQHKRNYEFNKFKVYNGNLGIVAGYGNLIILDIDDKNLIDGFDKKINTFSVQTGSGGRHYYFFCKEKFQKSYYVLGSNKQGELRCSESQVVIPNSTHPNGNKYIIKNNIAISNISKKEIRELLGKLLEKVKRSDVSRSGVEWKEVCQMVEGGYNFEDVDREMRLMDFSKWINASQEYRLHTYCGAVRRWKS